MLKLVNILNLYSTFIYLNMLCLQRPCKIHFALSHFCSLSLPPKLIFSYITTNDFIWNQSFLRVLYKHFVFKVRLFYRMLWHLYIKYTKLIKNRNVATTIVMTKYPGSFACLFKMYTFFLSLVTLCSSSSGFSVSFLFSSSFSSDVWAPISKHVLNSSTSEINRMFTKIRPIFFVLFVTA